MADCHQIWLRNVIQCPVDESWKTFSKIFTLGVICPQNLKSQVGQTGASLRAGYGSQDALQRDTVYSALSNPGSFRSVVNFFVRCTVAELQNVKIAKFLDFCLSSPYTTPKKYLLVTSLQPRGYIAEWFRFFHVIVEGPKECVPQQSFHATSGSGAGDSQTCRNFCLWQMAIPIQNTTTRPIRSGQKMWQSLRQETVS